MTKNWVGYIVIVMLFFFLSSQYPYFNMQYQRELLLGRGEIPWGGLAFIVSLGLYYFAIKARKEP